MQGPWWVLSVAMSFLGRCLALGEVSGWARRAAHSPENSGPLHQDRPPGFGTAGANLIVSGRCCTCSGGSRVGRVQSTNRSSWWGWLSALLPAQSWGGSASRLRGWEGSTGLWAKTPPLGTGKSAFCDCFNRHCGWKSFLATPDYRWEG